MLEVVQRAHHESVYDETQEKAKRRRKAKEVKDAAKRDRPWEVWEVALSPLGCGEELAKRQYCSRRTTKKNGGSDEDATRIADQRKQVDGGNTKKVETAKR